jgi:AcrR family transcriptional regulator
VARRSVEVRREEILAATVAEVQRSGLAATRVADVASALAISPALVFYHFETKDRLLADAFAYAAERDLVRLDKVVHARGTATQRLRAVLTLYSPSGSTPPGWTLWVDAWAAALRNPELRSTLDARMGWYVILGTIPVAVLGFVFRHQIKEQARDLRIIAAAMIGVAIVLWVADRVEEGLLKYRAEHGIESVPARIIQDFETLEATARSEPEYIDIVVSTNTMPREDWVRARSFGWITWWQLPFAIMALVTLACCYQVARYYMGGRRRA